jgi:ribosomal subunit interface protein
VRPAGFCRVRAATCDLLGGSRRVSHDRCRAIQLISSSSIHEVVAITMQLGEIMTPRVVTIASDEAASAAWTRMLRRGIRHLVVMDDSQLVGVVSERDLGGRAGTSERRGRLVRSMMTRNVVSAEPEMSVDEAADLMRERLIGSLPVMERGQLVGIATATDVFDALQAERAPRMSQAERQLLRAPTSSRRLGGSPAARQQRETPARNRRTAPSNRTKRAPMAAQLPRAAKRAIGRTEAPLVPANIRAMDVEVDDDMRDYIRRKLGMKLGKFALSIERVSVRLRDVNGPRGGIDHQCRVKVVLSGLPSVVVDARDASMQAAIDEAISDATRSVRRSLQRRRMTPLKRARSGQGIGAR